MVFRQCSTAALAAALEVELGSDANSSSFPIWRASSSRASLLRRLNSWSTVGAVSSSNFLVSDVSSSKVSGAVLRILSVTGVRAAVRVCALMEPRSWVAFVFSWLYPTFEDL